jgi:hypothetical protein
MGLLLDVYLGIDRFGKQDPVSELEWRERKSFGKGDISEDCWEFP